MTVAAAPDLLLEVADRVLARVPDSAEAEVTVTNGQEALTRFARSFIHQNVADAGAAIRLRLCLDGRLASATANQTDDAALDRLVRGAVEAARVSPLDPGWPGLAPPEAVPDVGHWDDATADADPDARAQRVRAFVDACEGLEAAGYCSTSGVTTAFANSAGQRAVGRTTVAQLDGIARTPTSDGNGRAASFRLSALDGESLGLQAARRARNASDPIDLEPGRYEVVLAPGCVANMLTFLVIYGFNGRAIEEGRSFVRLGERQFDAAVNLRDDVADPISVGIAFDAEGTPKRRLDLVRDGTTSAACHDRRTAKAMGVATTGHAIPDAAEWGAVANNLIFAPGEQTPDDLVAAVERGLLVSDFWYTRILDPRTQVVTGLTRNGVWLVEDGQITRPVRNLRFTQSYLEALAPEAVRGIGSDLSLQPAGTFGPGPYAVPSLRLASWNFTGGARG